MLRQADLVLVMEQDHKAEIEAQYPLARGRVFRLGHYDQTDIPDPYRKDDEVFRQVYLQLEAGVRNWADRIRKLGYQATA
jgi:protein-tyrosine phosphatase